ncbi:Uncharacterized protein Rs2_23585 [Raphanus sativus]|nr:Uncharacterized protein Rs2_23585 [Raphanus sativus]
MKNNCSQQVGQVSGNNNNNVTSAESDSVVHHYAFVLTDEGIFQATVEQQKAMLEKDTNRSMVKSEGSNKNRSKKKRHRGLHGTKIRYSYNSLESCFLPSSERAFSGCISTSDSDLYSYKQRLRSGIVGIKKDDAVSLFQSGLIPFLPSLILANCLAQLPEQNSMI